MTFSWFLSSRRTAKSPFCVKTSRYRPMLDCLESRDVPATIFVDLANTSGTEDGSSANPFNTIQEGITAAAIDDTVLVAPGNYQENVTINKNLSLLSSGGKGVTTITGQGSTALGAVLVTNKTTGVTLGGTDQGFTILGIDNANPGIESAAVYFQGNNSNATVRGNTIVAQGDAGLTTEYGAQINGFVIDGNEFSGQTFIGTPAGNGFGSQFSLANVPRQLIVISGGTGGGNTSNVTFTNNVISGTAGGINSDGDEQGNSLVTIDSDGATITGNSFEGTTTRYGSALRLRGPDPALTGNTFASDGMSPTTSLLTLDGPAPSTITPATNDLFSANTFENAFFDSKTNTVGLTSAIENGLVTLQSLIDNTPTGNTLPVLGGTFTENVQLSKGITLDGHFQLNGTFAVTDPSAILSPGPQAGIISTGDLTFDDQTTALMELYGDGAAGTDYDQLAVTGDVTIHSGALMDLQLLGKTSPSSTFILINNDGTDPIAGQFANLADQSTITLTGPNGPVQYRVNYAGGDGNDLALEPVPPPPVVPPPVVPPPVVPPVFSVGAGNGSQVVAYNPDLTVATKLDAFPGFGGGVRVATADVTGDGTADYILATGPGGNRIVILDGVTQQSLASFQPFESSFAGGLFVAAADLNQDGKAEVVVTPARGGSARVLVYSGEDLMNGQFATIASFYGLADFSGTVDDTFRGGVRVTLGDISGDGVPDLVVAAGFLGGPRVTIWDGASVFAAHGGAPTHNPIANFFAFESTLRDGVFVAAGDINGDQIADLIFGGGPTGAPRVRVADGAAVFAVGDSFSLDDAGREALTIVNFFAGDDTTRGGIRVASRDLDGDGQAELITGSGENLPSEVRIYAGTELMANPGNPAVRDALDPFATAFADGIFVG
ncbi:MAG: FG-GAP-like repeat-containing protein [Bacteroidales bacterium]|nr:FG-GAP-like repeat-containing protein [Bacteroidales bacterium]